MPALRTAVALAAIAVAVPSTASASTAHRSSSAGGLQPFYTFTATFQGSGTYSRKLTTTDGASAATTSAFRWTTVYRNVLIPRVRNPTATGFPAVAKGSKASGDWKITQHQPDGSDDCEGDGTLGRMGVPGGVASDGGLTLKRTKGGLQVLAVGVDGFSTPSGGGDGSSACHPKDFWHDVVLSGAGVGQNDDQNQPLTGITKITPKDLRKASFTKTVLLPAGEAPAGDCGSGDGTTCTQTYGWTGTVTFVKKKTPKGRH